MLIEISIRGKRGEGKTFAAGELLQFITEFLDSHSDRLANEHFVRIDDGEQLSVREFKRATGFNYIDAELTPVPSTERFAHCVWCGVPEGTAHLSNCQSGAARGAGDSPKLGDVSSAKQAPPLGEDLAHPGRGTRR